MEGVVPHVEEPVLHPVAGGVLGGGDVLDAALDAREQVR
jgi:hypothetical protein